MRVTRGTRSVSGWFVAGTHYLVEAHSLELTLPPEPGSTDALLTPLSANLHGLPPVLLVVAGTDPLLDDSLMFAARAAHDRVPVELRVTADRRALRSEVVPAAVPFLNRWSQTPVPAAGGSGQAG